MKSGFKLFVVLFACLLFCAIELCGCSKVITPYAFEIHYTDTDITPDSSGNDFDSFERISTDGEFYFDSTLALTKTVVYGGTSFPIFYNSSFSSPYTSYDMYNSFSADITFSFYSGTDNLYQVSFGRSYMPDSKMKTKKQYSDFVNALLTEAIDYKMLTRKGCELLVTSVYIDPTTGTLNRQNKFVERTNDSEITYIFSYTVYSNNIPTSDVTSAVINHRTDGGSIILTFSSNPFNGVKIPEIADDKLLKSLELAAESYPDAGNSNYHFIRSKSDRLCWYMIDNVPTLVCNIGVYTDNGVRIASQEVWVQPSRKSSALKD